MSRKADRRLDWWLPLLGLLGAGAVSLPGMVYGNDFGAFLATGVLWVIVGLGLVATFLWVPVFQRSHRRTMLALLTIATFIAASWLFSRVSDDVRTTCRWITQGRAYKAQVLAQPRATNGQFQHAEWDGWGFAGAGDTVVYLVFDPTDSLSDAARRPSPGRYAGIPCEVYRVRRMESHWYTVFFYTDTDWNHCS